MKKIIIGFAWMFITCIVQSAEIDRNRSQNYAIEAENKAQDLLTCSQITRELEYVSNGIDSYYNYYNALQDDSFALHNESKKMYEDALSARGQIIQNCIDNPESEYYNEKSQLPVEIKKITFELIRARGALTRNPYCKVWQDSVTYYEKLLLHSLVSGGVHYLADSVAQRHAISLINQSYFNNYSELQIAAQRYHELYNEQHLLLEKKEDRENFVDKKWHTFIAKLRDKHTKESLQKNVALAKQFSQLGKQTALATNQFIDTTIQEMVHELVNEQLTSIKLQENKRFELLAAQTARKAYEKKLAKITSEVVHDVVTTACAELKKEQELENKTREQTKVQLKKARKKEAESKKKSAQLEEDRLIAESTAQACAQTALLERINYEARLKNSGSISKTNLEIAMLTYDFTHLDLFDESGNLIDQGCVADFMILFTKLLSAPFVDTALLWQDVVKNITKIHEQLQGKNECLEMYVIDKNRLRSLLFEKEKEILALRTKILAENPKEVLDKLREERVKIEHTVKELKIRSQALGIEKRLQQAFIKKINELNQKAISMYEDEQSYKLKCKQLMIIHEIRSLQDAQGPFPLFETPLPMIIDAGYLKQQDLDEMNKILHEELHHWLSYEDVITHEDIERSLFKVLNKLSINRADHDRFAKHLAHDVLKFERLHYTPSENLLQSYFEHLCRIDKIHGDDFDINISADVAKIQNILLECFIEYQKHRAV